MYVVFNRIAGWFYCWTYSSIFWRFAITEGARHKVHQAFVFQFSSIIVFHAYCTAVEGVVHHLCQLTSKGLWATCFRGVQYDCFGPTATNGSYDTGRETKDAGGEKINQ